MLRRSGILSIPESKVNIKGRVKKFEGFKDMYAIGLLDCTDILIYNLFVFRFPPNLDQISKSMCLAMLRQFQTEGGDL